MAFAYGHFDRVFVNGESTLHYLQRQVVARSDGGRFNLGSRAAVVSSRGVPQDFCSSTPAAECDALPAVRAIRARSAGVTAVAYVGRLAFDKAVDSMLEAAVKVCDHYSHHAADG